MLTDVKEGLLPDPLRRQQGFQLPVFLNPVEGLREVGRGVVGGFTRLTGLSLPARAKVWPAPAPQHDHPPHYSEPYPHNPEPSRLYQAQQNPALPTSSSYEEEASHLQASSASNTGARNDTAPQTTRNATQQRTTWLHPNCAA